MSDTDDDLYDQVSAMADRLHLEGRERSSYIHEHMTRAGYDAVPQYVRREDDDSDQDKGGGSFFRGSRDRDRDRQERRPRGRDDRRDRDRGDDWYS